jgi:Mg2+ and Co2+ transporter CorA
MNFRTMPELEHPLAYWWLMLATVLLMVGMGVWLKSKRWF